MRYLEGTQRQRRDRLVTVFTLLGVLLIALAIFALLGDLFDILAKFRQPVLMFLGGAVLAYLMAPLVRVIQRLLRSRALSIATAYLVLFAGLVLLGVLLVNPFVSQARSLQEKLHNPAAGNLRSLQTLQHQASRIRAEIGQQERQTLIGQSVPAGTVSAAQSDMNGFAAQLARLSRGPVPPGQATVPPSYVKPINAALAKLRTDYARWQASTALTDTADAVASDRDSVQLLASANSAYQKAASTPLLLLNLQVWLDHHGMSLDLHDKFGNALQQLSSQLAGIVNNALGIALQAGGLLLNTILILIISVYFLSDGRRFVGWCVRLSPASMEGQAEYFVASMNKILGAYLRTQILMALIAGSLAAIGAVVFGVPYAVVVFLTTFFLSLVPVIGPLILPFPPLLIALVFTPLPSPIFYAIWLLAGEQIVTNVVGPRVQGHSVGIHPLEAMAAALIGFPIAGFLGSFFAVPAVAFLHVLVGSIAHARRQVKVAQVPAASREDVPVRPAPPLIRSGDR